MSAELIREHFTQYLGKDVGVSFTDPDDPRQVILYRPDRLSDTFVAWAYDALEKAAPSIALNIDRLLVSYESRLGRTQRGVLFPLRAAHQNPEPRSATDGTRPPA